MHVICRTCTLFPETQHLLFFLGGIGAYIHAFIPSIIPKSSSYFSQYIMDEIKKNGCRHDQEQVYMYSTSTNEISENDSLYKED